MKKMVGLILTVIAVLSGCASYYADDTGSVLLVGDSRVQMLPEELCEKMDAKNKGKGGTTTAYALNILKNETRIYDAVIISVGINDVTCGMTTDESLAAMRLAVKEANRISARVFVTTIPGVCVADGLPQNKMDQYLSANAVINPEIYEIAAASGITVIPLSEALNDGDALAAKYDDGSGIHYNAAGYAVIYDLYMSYLGKE